MNATAWVDLPDLRTPFILVQRERLLRNIRRVASIASEAGVRLRPHVKTHKSVELAMLQREHGADGLTASKPSEAEVFVHAGFKDILVAYPVIDPERILPLLQAAQRTRACVTFIADSPQGLHALNKAAQMAGHSIPVRIKIDVGLHRCGVEPDSQALEDLARCLPACSELVFDGLVSHAGHAYACADRDGVAQVARAEQQLMHSTKERMRRYGFSDFSISVGSTPTVLASPGFEGIHEIRPGNYVFLDLTAVRLGLASHEDISLGVVTTIISANADHYIIDAGSKALTSDLGAHSSGGSGFGLAMPFSSQGKADWLPVVRLSEEHGFIRRQGGDLPVGTRLLVLPNHACPVVNLFNRMALCHPGGEPALLSIDARGKVI
ncbi:alanine racemase [Microvirga rosea]|uniref:alanine racemase n=1 Tax=Microvirga rosea TaxID=2715425 RepID=UPI001D0A4F2B|nr:alanine racemase [Microvirga rosea]MCB8821404.1 alanine racemase [Microvirga rosea]